MKAVKVARRSRPEAAGTAGRDRATYVYCVLEPARGRRWTAGSGAGLSGADAPRLLDAGGGYQLVVASVPRALYDATVIDAKLRDLDWVGQRAMEHEAVVERCAAAGTVVPMKLFTIFHDDARALAHVREIRPALDRVVDRIAGCEEWGLRVFFDPSRAREGARQAPARAASGRDFLLRKKALDDDRREAGARVAAEADELYQRVAKAARGAVRRPVPPRDASGAVLLDAVFLVPASSVVKVKATVSSAAKRLVSGGLDLTLTGPWPAYSFIGEA